MSLNQGEGRLQEAIENLYAEFAKYSSWDKTGGCPCCHEPRDAQAMRNKKLRELSHEDLLHYSASALLTWGDENDFRHFLPRLFELSVNPGHQVWTSEFIFGRLHMAGFASWSKKEQDVIDKFFQAWWETTVSNYPCACPLSDVLSALTLVFDSSDKYLTDWKNRRTAESFRHFIESSRLLENEFYSRPQRELVREWLYNESTLEWLENGYYEFQGQDWSEDLLSEIERVSLSAAYRNAR